MPAETSRDGTQTTTLAGRPIEWDPSPPVDQRIGEVAAAQHGPISVAQLECCGLSARAARGRVRSGRLVRVHRGVYTPSHARLSPLGRVAGALLACRAAPAASYLTGAFVRGWRPRLPPRLDVTGGAQTGPAHDRVLIHDGRGLRAHDVELVNDLPVTSAARTLLDCAAVLDRRGTEKLVREAEYRRDFDLTAVHDLLAHVSRHPGAGTLRAALGDVAGAPGRTDSAPEDELLDAFHLLGVTGFELSASVPLDDGSHAHPDFLFRAERLVVEVDPRGSHDRTSSYRSDRRRDRALKRVADLDTMRFCDVDMRDPVACAAEVAERLAVIRGLRTAQVRKPRRNA